MKQVVLNHVCGCIYLFASAACQACRYHIRLMQVDALAAHACTGYSLSTVGRLDRFTVGSDFDRKSLPLAVRVFYNIPDNFMADHFAAAGLRL